MADVDGIKRRVWKGCSGGRGRDKTSVEGMKWRCGRDIGEGVEGIK